jgi:hypothetical protein
MDPNNTSTNLRECKTMANARGRKPGFRMSDDHRVKIQNSNILNALIEHVSGKREMSSTQVTAGIALMKKVLPDLSATTISGDEENPLKVIGNITITPVKPKTLDD